MTTPPPPPSPPTSDIARLRSLRSESFIPSAKLAAQSATIIGCGAVGRQVALMLAAIGFSRLDLWDLDMVSPENLGPQQWRLGDLNRPKTHILAHQCHELAPVTICLPGGSEIAPFDVTSKVETPFVFSCVDNMDVRRTIADRWKETSPLANGEGDSALLIDTRMTAFYYEIHAVKRPDFVPYLDTIFPQSEGDPMPCTARATAYCANACAALAVHTLIEHLRGNSPPPFFAFDLFSRTLPPNPHVKPEPKPTPPPRKRRSRAKTPALVG